MYIPAGSRVHVRRPNRTCTSTPPPLRSRRSKREVRNVVNGGRAKKQRIDLFIKLMHDPDIESVLS